MTAIKAMYDAMGPANRILLVEVILWYTKAYGPEVTFGTMCSGSDLCIDVLEKLSAYWRAHRTV